MVVPIHLGRILLMKLPGYNSDAEAIKFGLTRINFVIIGIAEFQASMIQNFQA